MMFHHSDNLLLYLRSRTLDILVPRQQDMWSCGFHTLYARHCLMKAMSSNYESNNVLNGDLANSLALLKSHFSYGHKEILALRSDIHYVIKSMHQIKAYSNNRAKPLEFNRSSSLPEVVTDTDDNNGTSDSFNGVKIAMSQCTKTPGKRVKKEKVSSEELAKQGRKELDEKKRKAESLANFHGKLRKGSRPDKSSMISRMENPLKRVKGQAAGSLRVYKDGAFRRALWRVSDANMSFQDMLPYVNKEADRTMKRMSSVSLIFDPLSEYPDREGKEFCPYRQEPKRIALCRTKEELNFFIKDLIDNSAKYIIGGDVHDIDDTICGVERPPLEHFIKKVPARRVSVQQMEENKLSLAKTNRLQTTPEGQSTKILSEDEEDLDSDLIGNMFGK